MRCNVLLLSLFCWKRNVSQKSFQAKITLISLTHRVSFSLPIYFEICQCSLKQTIYLTCYEIAAARGARHSPSHATTAPNATYRLTRYANIGHKGNIS
jgi:hypothetical protein